MFIKSLKIGNLVSKLPIIQGGMGVGVSLSGLSSAVANRGGIGVIAAAGIGMLESDFNTNFLESNIRSLKKQIQLAREKTKGVLGVNIMVALSNFNDMVKTAVGEGIDIIFSGAGLPLNLPEYLKGTGRTKLVPIVSSGRAARILSQRWLSQYNYIPDGFVVEGPKAGGHLGFKPEQINNPDFSLENIMRDVLTETAAFEGQHHRKIPVIAAGGIYTGKDIHSIMDLGASGVQMATRFVPTAECDASIEFKNAYVTAKEEDICIIKSPVGMPGRAIKNGFIESSDAGGKIPFHCPFHCIVTCDYSKSPYCIALALMNAKRGNMKNGFAFAGANAFRSTCVTSVKEVFESIESEYKGS